MGCWAVDSFSNDDAADWIAELADQNDLSTVRAAFAAVLGGGGEYLEAPEAAQALAAAEVVAAALGRSCPGATASISLAQWLARVKPKPVAQLVEDAIQAIDRILADDSELRELWTATEEFDKWQADVESLRARLHA